MKKEQVVYNGVVHNIIPREVKPGDIVFVPKDESGGTEERFYEVDFIDMNRPSFNIKGKDGIWYSLSYGAPIEPI